MPPSTPILKSILDDVKSSLEAIVAGADYFYTPGDVRMFEDYALDIARDHDSWPVLVIVPGEARALRQEATLAGTHPLLDHELDLEVIALHHLGSNRSEGAAVTAVTQLEHDIRKKLSTTYTRGGYAIDTRPEGFEAFAQDFQLADASVTVKFKVRYRTKENDPSSSG